MEPGNTALYKFKRAGLDVCLRAGGGTDNIEDTNNFECRGANTFEDNAANRNDYSHETWFYTFDRKLVNAAGTANLALTTDNTQWRLKRVPVVQGDTWTWDNTNKMLKNDRNNMCLDMRSTNDSRVDVQLGNCSATNGNQKIDVTLKTDPDNYEKAACKRNDQHAWAYNFVTNVTPTSRDTKAQCCNALAKEKTSNDCGYDYCLGSSACNTFYDTDWCLDHPTSDECKNRPSVNNVMKANWCAADYNRLVSDPVCQQVCDTQNLDVRVQCEKAAENACRDHPEWKQCGCLNKMKNVKNDPDYIDFVKDIPANKIPSMGDPECWLKGCADMNTKKFSELFRHFKGSQGLNCPTCIQNFFMKNTTVGGAMALNQECKFITESGAPSPSDTGPSDTSPSDTGPSDTSPSDTTVEKKSSVAFFIISFIIIICSFFLMSGLVLVI